MTKQCFLIASVLMLIRIINTSQGRCSSDSPPFYDSPDVNAATVCPIARDCKEWYEAGVRVSGIYPVKPDNDHAFQAYCDMETDGGGWTVLMRRKDGSVDFFNRNWVDYQEGFGKLDGEFWLGLSKMHRLTPNGQNTLRIDLGDFANSKAVALYSEFEILDATAEYAIVVKNYSGSAGDSLYPKHNLMRFTTKDNDNDLRSGSNCITDYPGGGWWFNNCYSSRLTGAYFKGGTPDKTGGVYWSSWKGLYSLKFAEMKTRQN